MVYWNCGRHSRPEAQRLIKALHHDVPLWARPAIVGALVPNTRQIEIFVEEAGDHVMVWLALVRQKAKPIPAFPERPLWMVGETLERWLSGQRIVNVIGGAVKARTPVQRTVASGSLTGSGLLSED